MGPLLLLWGVRLTVLLLATATLLPLWRAGFWVVRLCDFPRLQIAGLAAGAILLVGLTGFTTGWSQELQAYALLLLFIGLWQVSHFLPYTRLWRTEVDGHDSSGSEGLKIAVVNLKFDNPRRAEAQRRLAEIGADVLLLIEVDAAWDDVLSAFDTNYPHSLGVVRGEGLGMKLWSRRPLDDTNVCHLVSDERASLFASIPWADGRRVKFVGVHPTPPGLKTSPNESRHDSRIRDAELVLVAKQVEDEPDVPWVITGDFNDVAWSHTTRLFKRLSGLVDPRVGRGLYNTYHAHYTLLRYPIDHVLVSPSFRIGELSRVEIPGSDHFAIVAELFLTAIKEGNNQTEAAPQEEQEAEELIEEGSEDARERGEEAGPDAA